MLRLIKKSISDWQQKDQEYKEAMEEMECWSTDNHIKNCKKHDSRTNQQKTERKE